MIIIFFIILLVFSAFFSGSETAFLSLGKIRMRQIEKLTDPNSKRVVSLLSDPTKLLVTILVGNTFVNILASALPASFFYQMIGEKGIGVSIVTMTIIVLLFGEVTPKMFALDNADKFAFFVSGPLKFLEKLFNPIRVVLSGIAHSIVKGVGIQVRSERPKITEQEIRSLFVIGKTKGVVKEKEKNMIDSILELKDLNAADIMTPRIDITALDLSMTKEEIAKIIIENEHSRLPAYVHTLDNIVGVIYTKDFFLNKGKDLRDLVKKPYFAPESMKLDDLLQELQKHHMHLAVVTDEYGVTSGVVTIEDILEEIVGEIRDELDFEHPNIRMIDRKRYEINGQTHINEVNEALNLDIKTEEVDTIGGYVILSLGKIPNAGDELRINGYLIKVEDVSKNRITSLTIEKVEE